MTRRALAAVALILATSCESRDARLAVDAERAREQQVRHNARLAEQSQAVVQQSARLTAAAQQLVEQDAAARRELLRASQRFSQEKQVERAELHRLQAQLIDEKQAAAAAALRQPLVAEAVLTAGLVLAVLLPLLVTAYALRQLPAKDAVDPLLVEHLWEDLLEVQPTSHVAPPPLPEMPGRESPRLGNNGAPPPEATPPEVPPP